MEAFSLTDLPVRHYDHMVFDSARWQGFEPRKGDILVCTPYKAGTTWTQMICALLIFQKADFGRPLTTISPWLDILTAPIDEVLATYAADACSSPLVRVQSCLLNIWVRFFGGPKHSVSVVWSRARLGGFGCELS